MRAPESWRLAGYCRRAPTLRFVMLAAFGYSLACGGDSSGPGGGGGHGPFQVSALPTRDCVAGEALPEPLTALVIDSTRHPLAGVLVHFRVIAGEGTLASDTARTKADGKASVGFTCGAQDVDVEAEVSGLPGGSIFFIHVKPGPLALLAGLPLEEPAVAGRSIDLIVYPRDRLGNTICVGPIMWTVKAGGGSLAAASTPTGPWGKLCAAQNTWTLGSQLGRQVITLTVPEYPGFVDSATVVALSGPIRLLRFGNDSVFGVVAQPIPTPFKVQALTPEGAPFPNAPVSFNAGFFGLGIPPGFADPLGTLSATAPGGADCESALYGYCVVRTDAGAIAQIFFTPGSTTEPPDIRREVYAYVHTLGTVGPEESEVSWTVVALPGPPVAISATGGNNQSGAVGFPLSPLQVKVVDGYENGVPGQVVSWTVTSGGGTLASASATTDSAGFASNVWTLGPMAGSQTVTASISGGAQATFTALASP